MEKEIQSPMFGGKELVYYYIGGMMSCCRYQEDNYHENFHPVQTDRGQSAEAESRNTITAAQSIASGWEGNIPSGPRIHLKWETDARGRRIHRKVWVSQRICSRHQSAWFLHQTLHQINPFSKILLHGFGPLTFMGCFLDTRP